MGKADKKRKKWMRILLPVTAGLLVLITAIVLAAVLKPGSRKTNGVEQLRFAPGERLHGYEVGAYDGKTLEISEISGTDALLIFGMAGCRDCIADFPAYRLLYSLYNSADFQVIFIWDDVVPQKEMDELNIPPEASYTARGLYKFTDWVPSYYYIDASGMIIDCFTEIEEAVSFLPALEITAHAVNRLSDGVPILVGIENCGSCKQAYEGLADAAVDFVYYLEGSEAGEQASFVYGDPHKILSKAFDLDVYPVYIYTDDTGVVVDDTI